MKNQDTTRIESVKRGISKRNLDKTKKRKSPIDLYGIFRDKIYYESDAVLLS